MGVSEAGRVTSGVGLRVVPGGVSVGGTVVPPPEGVQETAINTRMEMRIRVFMLIST